LPKHCKPNWLIDHLQIKDTTLATAVRHLPISQGDPLNLPTREHKLPRHELGEFPSSKIINKINHSPMGETMRLAAISVIIGVGLFSASCVQKSIVPTTFSPQYKSMIEASDVPVVRNCAAISSVTAESALNGSVVGKRTLEESSFPAQTISINGDTTGWVHASGIEVFKRAMIKTGSANAPSVKLRLTDIQINENVHINAGYDARVTLDATVVSPYGKECWTGRKAGSSQDYGDHGSIENYRAVVDHALDRAVAAVAGDATFQDALCSNNCLNAKPESEVAAPSTSLKKRTAKRHK
jgi:hypothetical protein